MAKSLIQKLKSVTFDGYYRLGTKEGLIKSLYSRSQLTICQKKFYKDRRSSNRKFGCFTDNSNQSTVTGHKVSSNAHARQNIKQKTFVSKK